MSSEQKFRILSLDGGGIRGVITARILQEVQEQLGKPLNEYFDLIAGTSTGSILAAGIVKGLAPSSLVDVYLKEGLRIFPRTWKNQLPLSSKWLPLIQTPKYSHEGLIKVLRQYLGEIKLGQVKEISKAKLLILAYDTYYRNTTFFISDCSANRWFHDIELWKICVCSASAPTFFPPYELRWKDKDAQEEWKFPHVDGGVGANNPSLAALSHAIGADKQKLENISILSLGTGRTTEPFNYEQVKGWNLLQWAGQIPNVFMGSQFQIAADVSRQILTAANPNSYLRVQFELNQRFNKDVQPHQLLEKDQQLNVFTKKAVSEEMDDGRPETVQRLIDVTEAFIESEDYMERDGKKLTVKEAIAKFIEDNG